MKTQRNKNSKIKTTLIALIAIIFVVVIAGTGVYALSGSLFGWKPFTQEIESTRGDMPASDEQIETGNSIKENSLNNGGSSGSDQPQAPTEQPDGRQLVQVDITGVNKIESSTQVGVLISSLDSTGTCSIKVSAQNGTSLYTASSGVQAMSNTSTCQGFNIPNSALQDKYSIVVEFTSGAKYGTASYDNF